MNSILNVENLQVSFPSTQGGSSRVKALHDVSFSVKPGEIVSLVGESGCGKSLTGLSILNLIENPGLIENGTIQFENKNILQLTDQELQSYRGAQVSMIFQEPMTALNPVFTIGKQIEEVIITHLNKSKSAARQDAIQLLHKVGIPDPTARVDSYPFELSGGMRQRAMIAMALSAKPKLLIADEPTTALDVTIQAQILHLLQSLCKSENMSMLFISHDLAVVSNISDKICVMYAGKVVEELPASKIKQACHPYTRGLLASRPQGHGSRLEPIPGQVPELQADFAGCAFKDRCKHALDKCAQTIEIKKIDDGHVSRCLLEKAVF